jgi:hypothetical protein
MQNHKIAGEPRQKPNHALWIMLDISQNPEPGILNLELFLFTLPCGSIPALD